MSSVVVYIRAVARVRAEMRILAEDEDKRRNFAPIGLVCYRRDAMLARVLAMALRLTVSVSVTSRCSVETDERIELVFGMEVSFHLSYTAC